jgi:hypothetical protein
MRVDAGYSRAHRHIQGEGADRIAGDGAIESMCIYGIYFPKLASFYKNLPEVIHKNCIYFMVKL